MTIVVTSRSSWAWSLAFLIGAGLGAARAQPLAPRPPHLVERDKLIESARTHLAKGRLEESLRDRQAALTLEVKHLGPKHAEVANSRIFIVQRAIALGKLDLAEEQAQALIQQDAADHGPQYWRVRAVKLTQEYVAKLKKLPPADRDLLIAYETATTRIAALRAEKKLDQAFRLAEEMLAAHRKILGAESTETVAAQRELSAILLAAQRYEEAEAVQRVVLQTYLRLYGPEHPSLPQVRLDLVRAIEPRADRLHREQKFADEAPLRQEICELVDAATQPNTWPRVVALRGLLNARRALEPLPPPDLEVRTLLRDPFHQDSRSQYQTPGKLEWNAGVLRIPSSKVRRAIECGPRSSLQVTIRVTPDPAAKAESVFAMGFLVKGSLIAAAIRQDSNETPTTAIEFMRHAVGEPDMTPIARVRLSNTPRDGTWRIDYRFGLVELYRNGRAVARTSVEYGGADVDSFELYSESATTNLTGLICEGVPPSRRLSPEQGALVNAAQYLDGLETDAMQKGDFAGALAIRQESHSMRLAALGDCHYDVGNSLSKFGYLHRRASRYDVAHELFEQGLRTMRPLLGDSHLLMGLLTNNHAMVSLALGRTKEAMGSYETALRIFKTLNGEESDLVATVLNNLASEHLKQGDLATAEGYAQRSLNIYRKVLEKNHPRITDSQVRLAEVAIRQANYKKALDYLDQAYAILREAYGDKHPELAGVCLTMGSAFWGKKDYEKGLDFMDQAYELVRVPLGPQHPTTVDHARVLAQHLGMYAALARSSGDWERAGSAFEKAVALRRTFQGPDAWQVRQLEIHVAQLKAVARLPKAKQSVFLESLAEQSDGLDALREGRFEKALMLQKDSAQKTAELFGEESVSHALALVHWASTLQQAGQFERAIEKLQRARGILMKDGTNHGDHAMVLTFLAECHGHLRNTPLTAELAAEAAGVLASIALDREDLRSAAASIHQLLFRQADSLSLSGSLAESQKLAGIALRLAEHRFGKASSVADDDRRILARIERLGQVAPDSLDIKLRPLAELNASLAKPTVPLAEAILLRRKLVDSVRSLLGESDPLFAQESMRLAAALETSGDLRRAREELASTHKALQSSKRDRHRAFANLLVQMGKVAMMLQDFSEAQSCFEQAMAILDPAEKDHHDTYASLYFELSQLYSLLGDHERATRYQERSVESDALSGGTWSMSYVSGLYRLSSLYRSTGHPSADKIATRLMELADALKPESPAERMNLLAMRLGIAESKRDHQEVARRASELISVSEEAGLAQTTLVASATASRAQATFYQGEQTAALSTLSTLLAAAAAPDHPWHSYHDPFAERLAILYVEAGQPEKARPLQLTLARRDMQTLQRGALAQSEHEQLVSARSFQLSLDRLLSLPANDKTASDEYELLLAWKGGVLERQRRLRTFAADPQAVALLAQLQEVATELAGLRRSAATESKAVVAQRANELRARHERLEKDLAQRLARLPSQQTPQVDLQQLVAAIPPRGVLIDFVEYERFGEKTSEMRLAAYVVARGRPLARIELGPSAAAAAAIDAWRQAIQHDSHLLRGDRRIAKIAPAAAPDPANRVRQLIWKPLESAIGDAALVLLSPDGPLTRLPFAALPGDKPDAYLLEERALVVVPSPRMLPELAGEQPATGDPSAGLLMLGDVDFAAAPGDRSLQSRADELAMTLASPGGSQSWFAPLPGTKRELEAIGAQFAALFPGNPTISLQGARATEAAFRDHATKHRFLHFATHGFFAPRVGRDKQPAATPAWGSMDVLETELTPLSVGVDSGLVLTGANVPQRAQFAGGGDTDDGILTAIEVAATDLRNTELVVLSACETGLGQQAGGEGALGLQRAFQIAGAQSVVASLWQVDDDATQALMTEFYRNLWERKLGRLEALRQAQLAMLRGALPLAGNVDPHAKADTPRRRPPFAWAAFSLSGRWK